MFGCLRKIGCLLILLLGGAIFYWYARVGTPAPKVKPGATTTSAGGWEQLSDRDAERGRAALESLSGQSGPVFANLTAAEAASYIFFVAAKQLPAATSNVQASVAGERLRVRAAISPRDFGGAEVLGPLASLLGERDTVQLGGTIHVLRPGAGEFLVDEMRFGQMKLPGPVIPRLIARIRKGDKFEGLADNGLPMKLPEYIADVRIANGKITLYKSVK